MRIPCVISVQKEPTALRAPKGFATADVGMLPWHDLGTGVGSLCIRLHVGLGFENMLSVEGLGGKKIGRVA